MHVSIGVNDWTALCRSVVKVAIPQRRGRELPMNATRLSWVMGACKRLESGERHSATASEPFQAAFRLTALAPLTSDWVSKEMRWPSASTVMPAASTAETCTKTSLPPPSGATKPKPLPELKNFTVPIVMVTPIPDAKHMLERRG